MFLPPKNEKKKTINKSKISTSKNVEQTNKSNKIARNCWLSRSERLTSNKINYMFLPPKHEKKNIPADAAHILTTEIHSTVLKNENLTTKRRKTRQKNNVFLKQYSK